MKTHALERTSPKGTPFTGTCTLCGTPNLSISAATEGCPNTRGATFAEVLVELIDPPKARGDD